MTRPIWRVRTLLGWLVCALLAGLFAQAARADGPALTASFGIAGRYRPGGWYPVTVTVRNPGGDSIAGQIQVVSSDTPAAYGRSRPMPSSGGSLFARPVSLAANTTTPQTFQIDVRGIDPGTSDVTVQLVEGRERGDGRVLARISTQDQNTSAAITGTPVSDGEPLLVGFGGDPGAFKFLGGQKLSLSHTSGGLSNGQTLPNGAALLTTQVAEAATATDLPERAAGYGGVDAVLLSSDAPVEALTEAQTDALRGWVASGGHLIVCGGPDTTRFASSFYAGLLPATLAGNVLTAKPQRGIRVLAPAFKGAPTAVSGPYGAGMVTMTAADSVLTAHFSADQMAGYWRPLLRDGGAALLTHTATREEGNTPYYGGDQTLLSQAVMRGPSLDAPGTEVIGLFLLVYLIVLVPANYFLLKRLDRRELAWVTIPALVVVFALGTFAVGYAAKGGALFINRAAIVETTAGRREAGVYAEIGLFSPRRTSYDLMVPGENVLAALPNPGFDYGYSNRRSEGQSYGQTHFVQTPDGAALPDMAYNMWAMRAFDVQSTTDLGGTIDAKFTGLTGMVVNQTPHKLTQCAIYWNGGWQPLGDLAPGASLPVTLPTHGGNSTQLGSPPVRGQNDPNNTQADIHARMQASLAAYVGSLGQPTNNYYGGQPPLPYAPASNEALFIGWSEDPMLAGPAPHVDGRNVTGNNVSLLVVHIPISAVKASGQ